MALMDSVYNFIWADNGGTGSASDGQKNNDSALKEYTENCTLDFPDPKHLPHDHQDVPYEQP